MVRYLSLTSFSEITIEMRSRNPRKFRSFNQNHPYNSREGGNVTWIRVISIFVSCAIVAFSSLELFPDLSFVSFLVIVAIAAYGSWFWKSIWESVSGFPFMTTLLVSGFIGYATLRHFQGKDVANVMLSTIALIFFIICLCDLVPIFISLTTEIFWEKKSKKPNAFRT